MDLVFSFIISWVCFILGFFFGSLVLLLFLGGIVCLFVSFHTRTHTHNHTGTNTYKLGLILDRFLNQAYRTHENINGWMDAWMDV